MLAYLDNALFVSLFFIAKQGARAIDSTDNASSLSYSISSRSVLYGSLSKSYRGFYRSYTSSYRFVLGSQRTFEIVWG